ncbi:unnamed protein product [Amoebophrya sp. A25]|nr:unnamed protein product [Amoebophrya sp. A25]|eukprot:GSA25T00020823001.1
MGKCTMLGLVMWIWISSIHVACGASTALHYDQRGFDPRFVTGDDLITSLTTPYLKTTVVGEETTHSWKKSYIPLKTTGQICAIGLFRGLPNSHLNDHVSKQLGLPNFSNGEPSVAGGLGHVAGQEWTSDFKTRMRPTAFYLENLERQNRQLAVVYSDVSVEDFWSSLRTYHFGVRDGTGDYLIKQIRNAPKELVIAVGFGKLGTNPGSLCPAQTHVAALGGKPVRRKRPGTGLIPYLVRTGHIDNAETVQICEIGFFRGVPNAQLNEYVNRLLGLPDPDSIPSTRGFDSDSMRPLAFSLQIAKGAWQILIVYSTTDPNKPYEKHVFVPAHRETERDVVAFGHIQSAPLELVIADVFGGLWGDGMSSRPPFGSPKTREALPRGLMHSRPTTYPGTGLIPFLVRDGIIDAANAVQICEIFSPVETRVLNARMDHILGQRPLAEEVKLVTHQSWAWGLDIRPTRTRPVALFLSVDPTRQRHRIGVVSSTRVVDTADDTTSVVDAATNTFADRVKNEKSRINKYIDFSKPYVVYYFDDESERGNPYLFDSVRANLAVPPYSNMVVADFLGGKYHQQTEDKNGYPLGTMTERKKLSIEFLERVQAELELKALERSTLQLRDQVRSTHEHEVDEQQASTLQLQDRPSKLRRANSPKTAFLAEEAEP